MHMFLPNVAPRYVPQEEYLHSAIHGFKILRDLYFKNSDSVLPIDRQRFMQRTPPKNLDARDTMTSRISEVMTGEKKK